MRLRLQHKRRLVIYLSREEATQLVKELLEWDLDDLGFQEKRLLNEIQEILPELYDLL